MGGDKKKYTVNVFRKDIFSHLNNSIFLYNILVCIASATLIIVGIWKKPHELPNKQKQTDMYAFIYNLCETRHKRSKYKTNNKRQQPFLLITAVCI